MVPLPYQAYARAQATTSSQGELLILLYRGAARFAAKARLQIGAGEIEGAHNSLVRSQDIVLELIGGLKPNGDLVVDNLCRVHRYVYSLLREANLRKEVRPIDDAIRQLRDLLATWEQIVMPGLGAGAGRVVSIDRLC